MFSLSVSLVKLTLSLKWSTSLNLKERWRFGDGLELQEIWALFLLKSKNRLCSQHADDCSWLILVLLEVSSCWKVSFPSHCHKLLPYRERILTQTHRYGCRTGGPELEGWKRLHGELGFFFYNNDIILKQRQLSYTRRQIVSQTFSWSFLLF